MNGFFFHQCATSIDEDFCNFLSSDASIKKTTTKRKKNPITFISYNMLFGYRDNAKIVSSGIASSSFSSINYECIGNETSIHDCPNYDKKCTSSTRFVPRTELNCKGKS